MPSILNNIFKTKNAKSIEVKPSKTVDDMTSSFAVWEHYTYPNVNHVFQRQREPMETEVQLLKQVLDIVQSVPMGQALLNQVARMDYRLIFDGDTGNAAGYEDHSNKRIVLNPRKHSSAAEVAMTLVHEATHAVQQGESEKGRDFAENLSQYKVADQLKYLRSIEAGAWANEASFGYAIRESHPEILSFARSFPMFTAYEKEMNTSANQAKAEACAFKAWHSFEWYQKTYNSNHIDMITKDGLGNKKKHQSKQQSKEMTADDILAISVLNPQARYEIEDGFIASERALSLPKQQKDILETFTAQYKKRLFSMGTADDSVNAIFMDKKSSFEQIHSDEKQPASVGTSLMQKLAMQEEKLPPKINVPQLKRMSSFRKTR